ncbi:xanthine dehydrogenase family protein molybdopterin-binding subunit [Aliikangiella coralliicola]|uniref:Xanthine dehydrogenase family protein molybdopterin-binding subunit n=1 Tax=Aliikangiella coralliicola TaxID=2592383 RepID=A0A545U6E5_9GAMM|nr:molybdopterin cofactor-binding domain-containing protein [Aliikangiella coralliicola]TQV85048.1 xanthine dehydrogenase family protein molybdopterin-binding subunit [Aliikangiella coralliicola]
MINNIGEDLDKDWLIDEQLNDPTANETVIKNVSRRHFLKGLGIASSSMVLGIQLSPALAAAENNNEDLFSPDVFVSIATDGQVTIICHRSEMGQGIRSTLPLLVADELEADWKRVTVEQAIGDQKYGSQNTDGSRSVRKNYQKLKEAGAIARTMLQQAAAKTWKVKPSVVTIKNHAARLKDSTQSLDFSELVSIAATMPVPERSSLKLKTEKEQRYIGKDNIPLVDGKAFVTGRATFGFDVDIDDMKVAVIARPPVVFGKVKSFDARETLEVPGVIKIVELPAITPPAVFKMLGGIAVIADNTYAAIKGREKLKIEWDHGKNASYDSKAHEQVFKQALEKPSTVVRKRGDFNQAKTSANKVVEADYYVGGLIHAPMEPPAATARMTDDGVEVWTCTQTPQTAQNNVMGVLQIPKEKAASVEINVTLLGGGFGRKSKPDYVAEAAYLANQTKMPIKVLWTREDEVQHGYYHSPSYQKLAGTLDNNGKVTGWYHGMVNHPIGATFNPAAKTAGSADLGQGDMMYDVPNILVDLGDTDTFLRIGWVRSVTNINNAFAASSFVDELAHAAGKDPKDFLLSLIGKDQHVNFAKDSYKYGNYGEPLDKYPADTARLKRVIELVAEKSNWGKQLPKGHGMGIAAHRSFCSYVATVVEVSMDNGRVKLEAIHSAVDVGRALNPDRIRSQMEGSAIFSASLAFYGDITAKNGVVEQSNFHDYQMARMNQIPDIHTYIVESDELPTGIGEPGVPPFSPALCNAIFAATGERYRRLPLQQFGIV